MRKVDVIFATFSIFALAYVMRDLILPPSPLSTIFDNHGANIIAIITDQDCLECLEKTLCEFSETAKNTKYNSPDMNDYVIYINKDGANFNQDEFQPLCDVPVNFNALDYNVYKKETRMPAITPTILLLVNGKIVEQRPIDLQTDMMSLAEQFKSTIDSLRAKHIIQ